MRSSGCALLASASTRAIRQDRRNSTKMSLRFRPAARCQHLADMPHELDYDPAPRRMKIGSGFIANVSRGVGIRNIRKERVEPVVELSAPKPFQAADGR